MLASGTSSSSNSRIFSCSTGVVGTSATSWECTEASSPFPPSSFLGLDREKLFQASDMRFLIGEIDALRSGPALGLMLFRFNVVGLALKLTSLLTDFISGAAFDTIASLTMALTDSGRTTGFDLTDGIASSSSVLGSRVGAEELFSERFQLDVSLADTGLDRSTFFMSFFLAALSASSRFFSATFLSLSFIFFCRSTYKHASSKANMNECSVVKNFCGDISGSSPK
mmetsp:Transcript_11473/g.17072  ORF Transcript_11473/g.17072 Transcript_11473/m.17072 type:complete len:226 (+) Transcript_11473:210-887(+)